MSNWDQKQALRTGRAKTRDGRDVFGLREAKLITSDLDRKILIGDVINEKRPYPKGKNLKSEAHYWTNGGLGHHGGDDLVNA